eukprot:m.121925 g.121925  ORF g.121925 m.121925 type:complete len:65 (-) comp13402_c0_seq1:404-598(-)
MSGMCGRESATSLVRKLVVDRCNDLLEVELLDDIVSVGQESGDSRSLQCSPRRLRQCHTSLQYH